ncbi:hypothetical protein FPZ12_043805 [Amycolatopsis acidicola]|uniref:Nuclear transport factor 2 family protein n=1 Tax=Amycolatopsis acidicola TaxID=2596893 RepID=A0A5N0ULA3_9PSEU|nr:hypothetical protein [Amycolatopsis acidicola]KAA9149199.1 hypothetical protein FPZ12_043805 [Amycolatopsis acidicola]
MFRALAVAFAVVLIAGATTFLALRPIEQVHSSTPVAAAPLRATTTRPTSPPTTTAPPTTRTTTTTTTTVTANPVSVVENFYAAINERDFATAWALGGRNLGRSYTEFVAGFDGTVRDDLTVTSVTGQTVYVSLIAWQTDGTPRYYSGWYTVSNGEIQHGKLSG